MDQQNKKAIRLGIFIFIGLMVFTVGILAIGNINKAFTKTVTISTVFPDVNGLQPGDNVWFSGVKVGTVKEIQFLANANVEVTMKIENKSKEFIHNNALAKISTDGLIGNKIIVIYGGSTDAAPILKGDKLATKTTYSTEDMMDMLQENNKNILEITKNFKAISGKMAAGEGTIGALLTNDKIYTDIDNAIAQLRIASANVVTITNSVDTYTEKLNNENGFANKVVTDTTVFHTMQLAVDQMNIATTKAVEVANNLIKTTSDLNTNSASPVGVALHDEQAAASIKATITNLENSSIKLNESMEALQSSFLLKGFFRKKEKDEKAGQN